MSGAAKVGVGLGLGTKVAAAVNSVVAPVVAKMLRTLRDRALSNKDIQQAVEDMSEAAGVTWPSEASRASGGGGASMERRVGVGVVSTSMMVLLCWERS